jgi:hypothetical protein
MEVRGWGGCSGGGVRENFRWDCWGAGEVPRVDAVEGMKQKQKQKQKQKHHDSC